MSYLLKDTNLTDQIEIQRAKLQKGNPNLSLLAACRTDHGIASLNVGEQNAWIAYFENRLSAINVSYFIPASGSGSRMFDALYNFLNAKEPEQSTIEFVEHLVNCAPDFAFFHFLPEDIKADLKNGTLHVRSFVQLLLFAETGNTGHNGLNFGNLPKGLIPFHQYAGYVTNPFQEHILQGLEISGKTSSFHFTINENFRRSIQDTIFSVKNLTGPDLSYSFSVQNPATDAIAFDERYEPVKDSQGNLVRRPAGHGALLENLHAVKADVIFIRNIDNIQHNHKATRSKQSRKALAGILLKLRTGIFTILEELENGQNAGEKIAQLSNEFDLNFPDEKVNDAEFSRQFFNRPIRVCGMVRNEGQPGGGPFWVNNEHGIAQRQIIEKSQIQNVPSQLEILIRSTHFNPVELVCSTKNFKGDYFDLTQFRNDNLYFIVHKTHQGKPIQYVEEPGLWNGGMEHWITLFYEIESDCFSPVKTVLDLLHPLHRP